MPDRNELRIPVRRAGRSSPRGVLFAVLSGACLASAACSGSEAIVGEREPAEGEMHLAITRAATSQVPPEADSAVVRIWHPTAGTNLIRRVAIPNPNDTTRVEISAAARDGYSVGVMATLATTRRRETSVSRWSAVARTA